MPAASTLLSPLHAVLEAGGASSSALCPHHAADMLTAQWAVMLMLMHRAGMQQV